MLSRLAHSKNPHFANTIVNGRVSDSKLEAIVVAQRALTEKLADLTRKFSVRYFGLQVCCQPRLFVRSSRHFQLRRKQVPQALGIEVDLPSQGQSACAYAGTGTQAHARVTRARCAQSALGFARALAFAACASFGNGHYAHWMWSVCAACVRVRL